MSREASGKSSSDITAILDALYPRFDLRSAWDDLRFSTALAPGEDGDEGNDDGDGENDDDNGEDDANSGGDGEGDTKDIKDPDKKRLSDEAARYRRELRDAQTKLSEETAKIQEIEDKDKGANEVLERKLTEATASLTKAQDTLKSQAIRLAFFESGAAAQFRNSSTALRLLRDDLTDIEVDEDGQADTKAIKEAADALLKAEPYLGRGEDDGDGSDDDSGEPSGRPTNGKRKSKDDLNAEALAKKYPALRR